MHRIERIIAVFMKGMVQVAQTHCVYIIERKDLDAFASQRSADR